MNTEVSHFQIDYALQERQVIDVIVIEVDLSDSLKGLLELLQLDFCEITEVIDFVMDEFVFHKQNLDFSAAQSSQNILVIHFFQLVSNNIFFQEDTKDQCLIDIIDELLDDSYLQKFIPFEDVLIEFDNTIFSLLLFQRSFTSLFI